MFWHDEVLEMFLPSIKGKIPDDRYETAVMMLEVGEPEAGAYGLMQICEERDIPVPDDIIKIISTRYLSMPGAMEYLEENAPETAKRLRALEEQFAEE